MAEPHFAGDDDLPRTLRRERDAREREREQRDRDAAMAAQAQPYPQPGYQGQDYGRQDDAYPMPGSGVVNRLEIPFNHLVWFFIKSVFAAVPALLLLTALLFVGGQILKNFFPGFRHFEIVVKSTDEPAKPAAPAAAVVPPKK